MSTFTIPIAAEGEDASSAGEIPVTSTPDLSREQLLSFPAFKIWFSTLQHSLSLQRYPSHEFNKSPYVLRKIDIQAVDYFGGKRLGFIKFKADVSNDSGESLPGSVFLRGGSVGMLVSSVAVAVFAHPPLQTN
jgi:ADP-sugar diphosphatase